MPPAGLTEPERKIESWDKNSCDYGLTMPDPIRLYHGMAGSSRLEGMLQPPGCRFFMLTTELCVVIRNNKSALHFGAEIGRLRANYADLQLNC